jgi:hypothetical protein
MLGSDIKSEVCTPITLYLLWMHVVLINKYLLYFNLFLGKFCVISKLSILFGILYCVVNKKGKIGKPGRIQVDVYNI